MSSHSANTRRAIGIISGAAVGFAIGPVVAPALLSAGGKFLLQVDSDQPVRYHLTTQLLGIIAAGIKIGFVTAAAGSAFIAHSVATGAAAHPIAATVGASLGAQTGAVAAGVAAPRTPQDDENTALLNNEYPDARLIEVLVIEGQTRRL